MAIADTGARSIVGRPETADVGRLARTGGKWSAGLIVGRQAVSLVSTAILVRLLSPDDFGLVGMMATLTALLIVFADAGLSTATIHKRDLSREQVDVLFWVNAGIGVVLWLGAILVSPLLVAFYREPALAPLIVVSAFSFVLGGMSVQPTALLRRQMRFGELTFISITTTIAGMVTALLAALAGLGYWSLVVNGLAMSVTGLVLVFRMTGYRPRPPRRGIKIGSLVGFGGTMALIELLIYLSRSFDNVLVGRVWGTAELGYYTRAYALMMLPSLLSAGVLGSVMVPALSALHHDRQAFGAAYRKALQASALIGCPASAGLALVAPEVVRLVYGEAWLPVVPILAWLSVAGIGQPMVTTYGWPYTASGQRRKYLAWTVFSTLTLVAGFAMGVQWGSVGVAIAWTALMAGVLSLPGLALAHRAVGLPLGQSLRVVSPIAVAVATMAVSVFGVGWLLTGIGAAWPRVLAVKIAVGGAAYGLVILLAIPELPIGEQLTTPLRRVLAPIGMGR
jgi:O-antigen/teichoic acid export membrane protein